MASSNIFKYKYVLAIGISLLFHVSAIIGLIFTDYDDFFISNTPLNLYVSLFLILFTHKDYNFSFLVFFVVSFLAGLLFEIIGVNSQLLFGEYAYSEVLGLAVFNVPIFLGFLWFITMYIVGHLTYQMMHFIMLKFNLKFNSFIFKLIFVLLASFFAVFLDYFLEPMAIKFNLWQWLPNGEVPFFNYVTWFFCSLVLQLVFINLSLSKENKFASVLYIIQLLFFIILLKYYI